ncbi:MAG: radical SAM protein [Treponema sp.]|jgi:putative pyruvate formate lyase activating enzyme|nr:radical SAM protein [Treponema sp.]
MEYNSYYANCLLCPRRCGANRLGKVNDTAGSPGFCGENAGLRLASASVHRGEEPPITGSGGSGAIFVSGCNLGCVFCQNHQISRRGMGRAVSPAEFAEICLALQNRGAGNINIVTGSHAVPAIAKGLDAARIAGLRIPALWNTSAYESAEALELLRSRIDMYLPDLKTLDKGLAGRFFRAPGYPEAAAAAILKMMEYRPGQVIIRHLLLPGCLESTREVLRWFAKNSRGRALFSLMTQYTPVESPVLDKSPDPPARFVSKKEYETAVGWLEEFGIEDGFCQELVTDSGWLPDFNRANPFSSELSTPVWHWLEGFIP